VRFLALALLSIAAGWVGVRVFRGWGAAAGDRLDRISIASPASYWESRGFVELVTPIRAPSSADGTDRTQVWLKLPRGSVIQTLRLPDGRTSVLLPSGTEADRVESVGGSVADVRGTRIDDRGRSRQHVLRPEGAVLGGELEGFEWMEGDGDSVRAITDVLASRLRRAYGARAAERFGGLMDCAGCHATNKLPKRLRAEGGLPNRGTDGNGFYQILAVLSDEAPLELYRPRDLNVDDPFVRIRCGDGAPPEVGRRPNGETRVTCLDGSVPVGRLDLLGALSAGDERAKGVCRARVMLAAHLDEAGQRVFGSALRECAASS
jgi:hypothetical protein